MKTALFVCVQNSGRSQMAEAFFNKLAGGKAQALSAGTQPANEVNPVVVEAMKGGWHRCQRQQTEGAYDGYGGKGSQNDYDGVRS